MNQEGVSTSRPAKSLQTPRRGLSWRNFFLTGAEKRERFRGGTSKYGEESVPADAGKVIRASKLRSSTKWGLGSDVLREIYSLSKVLQHPAGDQGRLAGVNSRCAACDARPFDGVVARG